LRANSGNDRGGGGRMVVIFYIEMRGILRLRRRLIVGVVILNPCLRRGRLREKPYDWEEIPRRCALSE